MTPPYNSKLPEEPEVLREWRRRGVITIQMGEILDYGDRLRSAYSAKARECEELKKDAERLDWIERHLCRAGEVLDENNVLTGIMKCWQIVTQRDDSLRETVDTLRVAIDAARSEGGRA